jgi:hypothetical protein
MKKYFLLLIIVSTTLFFQWCAIQDVDKISEFEKTIKEQKQEIANLEKEEENNLFKKKLECWKLTQELIKKAKKFSERYPLIWKFSFEQVFYSPKYNNCLRILISESQSDTWNDFTNRYLYEYWNDFLDSIEIEGCVKSYYKWKRKNTCNELEDKIIELKSKK